jgi:hypothetical protein
MARRIPLPRLSRRQRTARWQRERRQQAVIVIVFSAVLFFVLGLVSWAASNNYYQTNLKPAMKFDGSVVAMRDWTNERKYQLSRFYVEFGVPPGYENDPQIAQQKASYDRSALDTLEEYAILDEQARADGVTVAPDAVQARYEGDYGQFRSRHILITFDTAATDKALDEANALAKATAIRDQLRQDPNNQDLWNQLAKDNSQDPGSANSGGELGWVGKGQFVKPFEDAAKALAIGQISDPVKSDFGYHVIQVEERRGPEGNDVVKRWLGSGFTVADIKQHVRRDILRDEFTKRQQDRGVTSPTAQVHVAQIQAATPRPVGGWIARGMLTDISAENELFNIPTGQRSQQHNGLTTTTWYKVIEKSDSRDLEDAQKKTISDNAYTYWLNGQKKAHNVLRLIPGLEFE